jgi:hypothetical protein
MPLDALEASADYGIAKSAHKKAVPGKDGFEWGW